MPPKVNNAIDLNYNKESNPGDVIQTMNLSTYKLFSFSFFRRNSKQTNREIYDSWNVKLRIHNRLVN